MICKNCPHKKEYRRKANIAKEVLCNHPDREYIHHFFIEHNIRKYEGFVGFINSRGDFPIKKCPKWCPLKKGGAE